MNEEIDITYLVSPKEILSENRKSIFRRWRWVRDALFFTVGGAMMYYGNRASGGKMPLPVLGLPIGGFLILAFLRWIAPARWLAQAPNLHEPKHMRITPERLFLETESVKSEFPWTQFLAWNESPANFMLDLTKTGYCSVIPKSAMTPEQQALFRQWATAKLPKS